MCIGDIVTYRSFRLYWVQTNIWFAILRCPYLDYSTSRALARKVKAKGRGIQNQESAKTSSASIIAVEIKKSNKSNALDDFFASM